MADHDSGRVVWVGKDRTKRAFEALFDALGPARAAGVEAISLDGSSVYMPVARERIPQATVCLDHFHVMKVRPEAPGIRVGCKDPTLGCRSSRVGASLCSISSRFTWKP